MASSQRKAWIDQAKGIGMILIVLGHIVQGSNPLCRWISSFHVPLFFILSGMLIAVRNPYAQKAPKDILLRKAKQLLYPYLTFSLLTVIYTLIRGKVDQAGQIIWLTAVFEGHNTLWFLPTIFLSECMLLILLKSRIPNAVGITAVLLGTSVYSALQFYVIGGGIPAEKGFVFLILNGLCRAGIGFCFMIAGYWAYFLRRYTEKIPKGLLFLISLAGFFLGALLGSWNRIPDLHYGVQGNPLLYYSSALLQSFGIIALCILANRRCAALEFFGKHSLIIMATHYPLPVIALSSQITGYMSTGMRYADALISCAIALLIESLIILIINRYASFMIRIPGRKRT